MIAGAVWTVWLGERSGTAHPVSIVLGAGATLADVAMYSSRAAEAALELRGASPEEAKARVAELTIREVKRGDDVWIPGEEPTGGEEATA